MESNNILGSMGGSTAQMFLKYQAEILYFQVPVGKW